MATAPCGSNEKTYPRTVPKAKPARRPSKTRIGPASQGLFGEKAYKNIGIPRVQEREDRSEEERKDVLNEAGRAVQAKHCRREASRLGDQGWAAAMDFVVPAHGMSGIMKNAVQREGEMTFCGQKSLPHQPKPSISACFGHKLDGRHRETRGGRRECP
jgi:hypothetical protein